MKEYEEFIDAVIEYLEALGYENVEDMSIDSALDAFVAEWNFNEQ